MAKIFAALHVGNRVINGLALRPAKRGWTVAAGATLALPDDEQQDPAPVFRSLARQLKLHGGQPTTLCLGRQQAIIRSVQLPSTDPAELAQMARFEAERHIPFNAERHSVGYHIMRSKGVEGSDVLLGAVDGPVVSRGLECLAGAGLAVDGITISSTCLVNSLLYEQKETFAKRTQAILSIGLDSLDLVFLHQGRVLYARSVALDLRGVLETWIGYRPGGEAPRPDLAKLAVAAHMIDCEKLEEGEGTAPVRRWIDRVGQEIRRTYDFARREMKCPPIEAMVLTGEGAALRNLDRLLAKGAEATIEVLNPVAALPGADRLKFPFQGLEYTIVFGALIGRRREGAYDIDLTPASHYRSLARRALARRLVLTGVLFLMTVGLGGYTYLSFKRLQSQALDQYKEVNARMKPIVDDLSAMQTKLEIIKTFIEDPNAALTVFDSIVQAPGIPDNAFLEKISYVKGESVTIEGRAKSIPDISLLIDYLNETRHFQTVQRVQNPTTLEGKPVYNFKLDCTLKGEEEKP